MALARKNLVIADEAGNILDGASIEVRREAAGLPLVSLYSDRDGLDAIGNPFTAADGSDAGFHVAGGAYKITATKDSFTKIWRYEPVGLGQESDQSDGASAGFIQAFDSSTSDADPGAGEFRLNHATPTSATAIYLDNVSASSVTVSGIIDLWDDSTSTIKGKLKIEKVGDPGVYYQWNVTGSVVDGTGYRKVTLTSGQGAGTLTAGDQFVITFVPKGDKGDAGASGGVSAVPGIVNGKIVESHSGNAVTFALKNLAGNDPDSGDPVVVTLSDGSTDNIEAALSVTVSSGSTLGTANSVPFRVWVVLIDDGGTWRMGVRQCSSSTGISGFPGNGILTSAAEGGAGAADSAGVTYTGTAVTAKPYAIAAMAEYDSGLATAGTWASSPTRIANWIPGMPRPGDVVQGPLVATHATSESTNSTTYVDTSLTKAITPTSACNPIAWAYSATNGQSTASKWAFYTMRRGGTPVDNGSGVFSAGGIFVNKMTDMGFDRPGAASSQTYTLAYKTDSGGDAFLCTSNLGSIMSLTELMG